MEVLSINPRDETIKAKIKKDPHTILKGYGGSRRTNTGAPHLKTITTKFDVMNTPLGNPSIFGCRQARTHKN